MTLYSHYTLSLLSVPCYRSEPSRSAEILCGEQGGMQDPVPLEAGPGSEAALSSVGRTPRDSAWSTLFNFVFTPGVTGAWWSKAQFLPSLFPNLRHINLNVRSTSAILTDNVTYDRHYLQRNNLVYWVQKQGNLKLFYWFPLIPNKSLSSCFNKWWLDMVNLCHIFNSLFKKKDISLKLICICWNRNTRKIILM